MFSFPIPHFGLTRNQVSISANTQNYNLADVLGSPTKLVRVVLTIDTGVEVTSSDSTIFAFDTGSLPAGSQLKIINKGKIGGAGGDAGNGGAINGAGNQQPGAPGVDGGDAMNLQLDVSLDNTNGNIEAGGGGGGGGGAGWFLAGGSVQDCHGAGGGGGGAGDTPGARGSGGLASACTFLQSGQPGTVGTTTTGGIGGLGAHVPPLSPCTAGRGGDGGDIAEFGQVGGNASGCTSGAQVGGNGGEPGKAINLNGNTVTFLGGNTPARVKGAVA